jgi:two-component system, cell cycle response regulator
VTTNSSEKPQVLVIDDDQNILDAIFRDLRDLFSVQLTSDVEEIPHKISKDTALVICDYNLGDINGLSVLEKIKDRYPSAMRILLTGEVGLDDIGIAIQSKLIHKFILKPWDPPLLRLHMLEAVAMHLLLNERDKFKELSITDPVTDLTNHRFFQEKLRIELNKAKAYKSPLSLIMIDVDHFKILNDQFGHPRGDQILAKIAQTLTSHLKSSHSLSRYGGEEFALILPQTSSMAAFALAETLRKSILNMGDLNFRLSISLGIATFPEHGLDADELLSIADQALYCAKRQGRNMSIVGLEIT